MIEIGHRIAYAEKACSAGTLLLDDLATAMQRAGYSRRMRFYLMAVAKHPLLTNPVHHGALPFSPRTLGELAAFASDELDVAKAAGLIDPDMERMAGISAIKALVRPKPSPEPKVIDVEAPVEPIPLQAALVEKQVSDVVAEDTETHDPLAAKDVSQEPPATATPADPSLVPRGLLERALEGLDHLGWHAESEKDREYASALAAAIRRDLNPPRSPLPSLPALPQQV